MIIAIGCDIEEISRFRGKENDSHFLETVCTPAEISYIQTQTNPSQHLAARFCGKEAILKALSKFGISLELSEIEIINDETGRPIATIQNNKMGLKIEISLSHCKTYAMAQALITSPSHCAD